MERAKKSMLRRKGVDPKANRGDASKKKKSKKGESTNGDVNRNRKADGEVKGKKETKEKKSKK